MPPARSAWLVVALLVPVALLNYLDRQMMATMKDSVMESIPTIGGDVNWGVMLGQFKWVYAFLSPVGGLIADRLSRRFTIVGSLFVWSAVTWWTGQVTTFQELLWARSLMGISEAFYIPAALALITDYHTGHTRSRAIGLHQMGIYLGQIAGAFGGFVADAPPPFGWRFAFTACGVAGMAYAVPLLFLLKDLPRPAAVGRGLTALFRDLRDLITNVSFLLLVLYFTLPAVAGWVVRDWMPDVLKKAFGLSQGWAGVAAILSWQVPAIAAAVLGGWLADGWVRRTTRGRVYVSAIGTALIVPAIAGVGFAPSVWVAVGCLVVFGIGWGFFDGNNMPILSQLTKPQLLATGYGLMNLVSISVGGLADVGFGALTQNNVPIQVRFGALAVLAAVSVGLVLLIRPPKYSALSESGS